MYYSIRTLLFQSQQEFFARLSCVIKRNIDSIFRQDKEPEYNNVGKIIVEHEQENKDRADYGKQTLKELSKELTKKFGKRFFCF